jgi:hypothetical protein
MLAGHTLDIQDLGVTLEYISKHDSTSMKMLLEKIRPTPLLSNVDVKNKQGNIIQKDA